MTLKDLPIGKKATIAVVGGEGALRQHFLDMGVIPGSDIVLVKYAPLGDPMEFMIHGYELTLRVADAEQIEIEDVRDPEESAPGRTEYRRRVSHPGLGESGKYHEKATENPLPDSETLTFALAGNQNCGKTTLFNQLTGSNQHVGNFPGVTVDRKDGIIKGHDNTLITDLPGIYSLSPYTSSSMPSFFAAEMGTTGMPRRSSISLILMEPPLPFTSSIMFSASTMGTSSSMSCMVR